MKHAELLGIDKTVLTTAAELRLRRSGIKVAEEAVGSFLYINVNLLPVLDSYVAFNVTVEFKQFATLRVNGKVIMVVTWSNSVTGGVGKDKLRDIREDINDKVDEFINDYLAANQDRPTTKKLFRSSETP